jgi:hypothetical protein
VLKTCFQGAFENLHELKLIKIFIKILIHVFILITILYIEMLIRIQVNTMWVKNQQFKILSILQIISISQYFNESK